MKTSRFSDAQIVGVLQEHERGAKVPEICRKHGITEPTFYRWKRKFGGMQVSEAKRLKALEEENRRLEQLVAEQALDNRVLRELLGKTLVTAEHRRTAVRQAQETAEALGAPMSEGHACRLVGIGRATHRYHGRRPHGAVRERLRALAGERPRWGYRRLAVLLAREGHALNHKLVHRLYREEGLVVRRRRRKRAAAARVPLAAPARPSERWAMDFVSDALADGRKIRCLTLVDAFTRECPAIEVGTSLPGERVARVLDRLVAARGAATAITVDNGPELAGKALDAWAYRHGVSLDFITPGKPVENAFIESFNGKFRDECLPQHWFLSLPDARVHVERYRRDYNEVRPHSALDNRTPAEFAREHGVTVASPPQPRLSLRMA